MTDSIIQHLLENKKHTANHRNSKKTTTFVFNKCSVTYLRKCPIIQHLVSDSGHSQKRLKESGTTHICKAMKYTDLHLSPHSVYLPKQRLYRLKWTVTDNQWCKYAASASVYKIEAKGKDLCEVQFFGKFIMCSNNEDTPVLIEPGETRYWVRKINPLKKWRYEFSSKTNHGNPSISLLSSTPSTNYGQKKQNVVQSATDTTSL